MARGEEQLSFRYSCLAQVRQYALPVRVGPKGKLVSKTGQAATGIPLLELRHRGPSFIQLAQCGMARRPVDKSPKSRLAHHRQLLDCLSTLAGSVVSFCQVSVE